MPLVNLGHLLFFFLLWVGPFLTALLLTSALYAFR